jgi:hypothetical protein
MTVFDATDTEIISLKGPELLVHYPLVIFSTTWQCDLVEVNSLTYSQTARLRQNG